MESGPDLESDPSRELVEEFHDALGIQLKPEQYFVKPLKIVVEGEATPTENVRSAGNPTARIYRIYEVQIEDPTVWQLLTTNCETHPPGVLRRLAIEDSRMGGRGQANAILVASAERISSAYQAFPPEERGSPLAFDNTFLEGNVAALFEDIDIPKYQRTG